MNIILKGQLAFMNQYFEVLGVTSYDEKHFKACGEREGIRMIPIEMHRTISLIKDVLALWQLYQLIKKEKPEIVHSHTPKAGLLGMLAAKWARVPIRLHTVGGMPLTEAKGLKKRILNFTEKLTYQCALKVYPNSNGLKEIIIENNFCPNHKLKVIANGSSNGVNTAFFSADFHNSDSDEFKLKIREDLGIAQNDFVFLFVGRIAKDKGIGELIDAFNRISDEFPDTKLLLIGPFEQANSILDEAYRNEIIKNENIIAPGRFDDVRPYYACSDTYVFPSYREGFPNSLMEAGAMGLPIIATDINGCNEIVRDRENGLLIKPKDVDSLYQAMLKLRKDDSLIKNFSLRARPSVEEKFSNKLVWQGLLDEYRYFLNQN